MPSGLAFHLHVPPPSRKVATVMAIALLAIVCAALLPGGLKMARAEHVASAESPAGLLLPPSLEDLRSLSEGDTRPPPRASGPSTEPSWLWVSGEENPFSSTASPDNQSVVTVPEPITPGHYYESASPPFTEPEAETINFEVASRLAATTQGGICTCPPSRGPLRRAIFGLGERIKTAGRWENWLDNPGSAGLALGYAWGTELVDNWVEARDGWWGSFRLGWDFHPHYGVETRLSFGSLDLWDHPDAVAAARARNIPLSRDRYARTVEWDTGLIFYGTTHSPWRPYIFWGVGLNRFDFNDLLGNRYEGTYFAMPIAFGIKFRPMSGPVLRFEIADQVIFPSRFNVTHQFSATIGLEMRFGKKRRLYWPWEPAWP